MLVSITCASGAHSASCSVAKGGGQAGIVQQQVDGADLRRDRFDRRNVAHVEIDRPEPVAKLGSKRVEPVLAAARCRSRSSPAR